MNCYVNDIIFDGGGSFGWGDGYAIGRWHFIFGFGLYYLASIIIWIVQLVLSDVCFVGCSLWGGTVFIATGWRVGVVVTEFFLIICRLLVLFFTSVSK